MEMIRNPAVNWDQANLGFSPLSDDMRDRRSEWLLIYCAEIM
jgi:hypothetical protein